jgi:hypothetical protein
MATLDFLDKAFEHERYRKNVKKYLRNNILDYNSNFIARLTMPSG